ncbi:PREDICTED: shufflon protein A'-like [Rhagoletis zephyria]|uniref:shufflon protein A'-like n=1 Tax=Rhagoletis zephyria TaxID=28612 RepID=UPI0008114F3A|nr:PREDICTED: shufflon protein A'-like [Rhagoletis zephyria]
MLGAQKYNDYLDEKNWQLEALRLTTWTAAVRQYVGDRYDTIVKNKPTAGKPHCVGTQSLKDAGLLSSGFALKNPEGQTLRACLVTLRKDASRLEGMIVSEGGVPLTLKAMLLTSRDIRQGYGGYIEKAGVATGAQKAWTAALTGYGINNGTAGHMTVLLSADDLTAARSSSQEDTDRLYRFKTPGRPELNAMKTDIDMSGNNLNNTGTVNATTGKFSGNINAWEGNFGGAVSVNGNITGQNGYFRGRLTTNEYLQLWGLAQAGQGCYPNGLIARDTQGAVLSCQNGIWMTNSGVPVGTIIAWGAGNIPSGWLICNGSSFSKAAFPALAAYYPDGRVPDFRGVVLRGLDQGAGLDSEPARGILSYQGDALQDHTHIAGTETGYHDNVPSTLTRNTPGGESLRWYNDRSGNVNTHWGNARISTETRTKNRAVFYLIKAR